MDINLDVLEKIMLLMTKHQVDSVKVVDCGNTTIELSKSQHLYPEQAHTVDKSKQMSDEDLLFYSAE